MLKSVHVLIVGGGISGLTLANLLIHGNKKVKFHITLFESRPSCAPSQESIGGGIGLWPPSQTVLRNLPNYQDFIEQFGFPMPCPGYRDTSGRILANPHEDFARRFPVQCLNRDDLIRMLLTGLNEQNEVKFVTSQQINSYERHSDQIVLRIDENKLYTGDLLIACDGIHSKIRNCLMSELELPPVLATDLGYSYFRANTQIPINSQNKWWLSSFETWGTCHSKPHGAHEIRFGFVPLKPPHVFWFIAIKTQKNHKYLSPIKGVKLIDEDTKMFLLDLVRSWKPIRTNSGDTLVDYAELIHFTDKILRTDIAKINAVEKFPWISKDNRVVLMGDSAHATAPNIAQGAGLCIEDAACMASKLNRVDYLQGLAQYEAERKPRAKTVQKVADFIATVGQVKNPFLKRLRDWGMRFTTVFPSLQRNIFEQCVSFSLGGSRKAIYWQAPQLNPSDDAAALFARAFPDYHALPNHVKAFKTSSIGGSGSGLVTVEKPGFLAKVFGWILGFPKDMIQQAFYAEVINSSKEIQTWRRVFGYKTSQEKSYSTTHSIYCDFNCQSYLSESLGGFLGKFIRFIYTIKLQSEGSLKYESQGLTFFNSFKAPLPRIFLPKSEWIEKPTEKGWQFDGKISFPVIGTLLHYYGDFKINTRELVKNKRVIIAGGSGMIGKEACLEFIKKGYDVYCLSRSTKTKINVEGIKIRLIDENWSDLIDKNTIIVNLSGANPGAKRWSDSVKSEIAESRFRVIDKIILNIERAKEKPLKYLQASAAGVYGHAGNTILTEESEAIVDSEPGTKFRVEVCKEIERRAKTANCDVVNLRIGHVFSNSGGLLPYCRLAGFFCISRFGSGNQFVPFIHLRDVVKAIEFIASSKAIHDGAINLAAPQNCTNSELLQELRLLNIKWGLPLPEFVLKCLTGQSFVVLTDSERVQPKRLIENGFKFDYNTINECLYGLQ